MERGGKFRVNRQDRVEVFQGYRLVCTSILVSDMIATSLLGRLDSVPGYDFQAPQYAGELSTAGLNLQVFPLFSVQPRSPRLLLR